LSENKNVQKVKTLKTRFCFKKEKRKYRVYVNGLSSAPGTVSIPPL